MKLNYDIFDVFFGIIDAIGRQIQKLRTAREYRNLPEPFELAEIQHG